MQVDLVREFVWVGLQEEILTVEVTPAPDPIVIAAKYMQVVVLAGVLLGLLMVVVVTELHS